jgi:hypothetical protein
MYLPGLVDYSFCYLKISVRCFRVWRTRCKKTRPNGTECGSDCRRFFAIPNSEILCDISPQQKSQMEVIVSFLVRIELNYREGWGSINWTTREYSQRLGFQYHRTDLLGRARETKGCNCYSFVSYILYALFQIH